MRGYFYRSFSRGHGESTGADFPRSWGKSRSCDTRGVSLSWGFAKSVCANSLIWTWGFDVCVGLEFDDVACSY